jgi:MGT family glycosyltransferase
VEVSRLHLAFFSFPGLGHLRPVLPVVRESLARGHDVSFVVAERFADMVAKTGARVITYESEFPAAVPDVVTADDLATVIACYFTEAFAALPVAWREFADRPADVFVEDALSTAVSGLVADRAGRPVVRVFPGFAGNDDVPLNGSEPEPGGPSLDPDHPAITGFQRELPERLAAYGIGQERLDRVQAGGAVAANLVFVPELFQPRAECFGDDFVFVGPEPPGDRPAAGWTPPADGARVVLVSLGTSSNGNPEFFRACGQAFAGSGWRVVMTTAGHVDEDTAAAMPDNVELHAWLDHHAVLPHADVVVCQAGAGSLMDAFGHGVPVVVVPQQPDAKAMARHVAALGLGRALLGPVTGTQVREAVDAVAADTATAARVAAMRSAIRSGGGATRAADVLERVAAGPPIDRESDAAWT